MLGFPPKEGLIRREEPNISLHQSSGEEGMAANSDVSAKKRQKSSKKIEPQMGKTCRELYLTVNSAFKNGR